MTFVQHGYGGNSIPATGSSHIGLSAFLLHPWGFDLSFALAIFESLRLIKSEVIRTGASKMGMGAKAAQPDEGIRLDEVAFQRRRSADTLNGVDKETHMKDLGLATNDGLDLDDKGTVLHQEFQQEKTTVDPVDPEAVVEEVPELHWRTYAAIAALFFFNFVHTYALTGPPAIVRTKGDLFCSTPTERLLQLTYIGADFNATAK